MFGLCSECSSANVLKIWLQRGFSIFAYSYLYWTVSRTREVLMKMNKDVLAGMVLDYKERFDSTFSTINDEPKEQKTNFGKLESCLATLSCLIEGGLK